MNIAFIAAQTEVAEAARAWFMAMYGETHPKDAAVIVVLGGDGVMLECLHKVLGTDQPVYGMNCGSVGFLMNEFQEAGLPERIARAQPSVLHPLRMHAITASGVVEEAMAINEVSLLRQLRQAAKIRIHVDHRERLSELICDGVLISTPAGFTAYNLSAHGPIIPLSAEFAAFDAHFRLPPPALARRAAASNSGRAVRNSGARQTSRSGGGGFYRGAECRLRRGERGPQIGATVLFDPDRALSERIITEQFTV